MECVTSRCCFTEAVAAEMLVLVAKLEAQEQQLHSRQQELDAAQEAATQR